jgi:HD-GYP domain-containing protein (c-di-GMP phosphodiesterase class II)
MRRPLTDLGAVLSLAGDLGHGGLYEHQLRVAVLARRIADALRLSADEQRDAFDAALLRWLGCTATAQPLAAWMGDDIEAHRRAARFARPLDPLLEIVRHTGTSLPLHRRVTAVLGAVRDGPGAVFGSACEAGERLAARLGYGPGAVSAVAVAFERFDGKGWPGRMSGEALPVAARVAMVAEDAATLAELSDTATALAEVSRRSGRHYDPGVVQAFTAVAAGTFAELAVEDAWQAVMAADPAPQRMVAGHRVTESLEVVADFVDIKAPFLAGHSRGVAAFAAGAAERLGLPPEEATALRSAGLLHDLGRVAVSNLVWDRPGPLSSADLEQVRLHTYHVERFCARSSWLAPLGALAALHHERLDGSGYHRGQPAAAVTRQARILAASDVYQALRQQRPHRPAYSPSEAARLLRAEVRSGRLDADAAEAVLAAAGQPARARREHPAGLTASETEVLALLAQGLSNKQIAARLVVSHRTVGHHIAHAYQKTGVTTRAGATLFALQHDLLDRWVGPQDIRPER